MTRIAIFTTNPYPCPNHVTVMHQSFGPSPPPPPPLGIARTFTQHECENQWSSRTPGQKYCVKSPPLGVLSCTNQSPTWSVVCPAHLAWSKSFFRVKSESESNDRVTSQWYSFERNLGFYFYFCICIIITFSIIALFLIALMLSM